LSGFFDAMAAKQSQKALSIVCDIDDDELWEGIERDLPDLMPKPEAILGDRA
jgi:hypothetical protein